MENLTIQTMMRYDGVLDSIEGKDYRRRTHPTTVRLFRLGELRNFRVSTKITRIECQNVRELVN